MNTNKEAEKETVRTTSKVCPLTDKPQNKKGCKKCHFNPEDYSLAEMSKLFSKWL